MGADFSELMQLAVDIESAPRALPKYLRKALDVSSIKVKKDAQSSVGSRPYFSQTAAAIDYELSGTSGAVSEMRSDIGYNKDKDVGKLGNLAEFGAPRSGNQLAPGHDLGNALIANEGDFVYGVERAVSDAQAEVGL